MIDLAMKELAREAGRARITCAYKDEDSAMGEMKDAPSLFSPVLLTSRPQQ